ncbi:CheR family methyltransferase [Marimonas lutisalis]|uniref:CheR family methyltransferase n=1 Tax=Marimonas lutisalis TaxID=2545756 RepID=UPI0010F43F98|nr:CheR family methyltransferase [Marimonas lutisalis]
MSVSPDYKDYSAKPPGTEAAKANSLYEFLRNRVLYDTILLPYGLLRHRRLLKKSKRVNDHTYTCFLRGPAQLRLLTGPVLDFIRPQGRLDITLLACSNGAETYTIASVLRKTHPDLDFHIYASDLHQSMIDRAKAAEYSSDEVLHSVYMTEEFLQDTFLAQGDSYVVRPELREYVSFSQANLLDGETLRAKFGQSPLVIAQNVLFHLTPEDTASAFDNLVSLLAPRGVLLIEGMQLDLRVALTKKYGLSPFTQNLRQIFQETRVHTPPHWWRVYWGTEPFLFWRKDRARRYGTAFKRDEGTSY